MNNKILPSLVLLLSIFLISACEEKLPVLGDVHIHADFAVYLEGEKFNFSQDKYMQSKDYSISNFIHMHDGNGDVIHQHISGANLDEFFYTINFSFTSECFVTDGGVEYCNGDGKKLRMFINGKENFEFEKFEFEDLDRILITYGDESESVIKQQMDSVTDKSCIESGKCPERGSPSDSSSCAIGDDCVA